MGLRCWDIVATLVLNLIHCAYTTDHILSCNVTSLEPCPESQFCNQTTLLCECEKGLVWVEEECTEAVRGGGGGATAAVVAVFTLALIVCGLVLVVRKYNLVDYARQKINQRRGNNVMYEDVMIGQDDPPLSL